MSHLGLCRSVLCRSVLCRSVLCRLVLCHSALCHILGYVVQHNVHSALCPIWHNVVRDRVVQRNVVRPTVGVSRTFGDQNYS